MLTVMLNHIKQSTFLLPFFIGAMICAIVGGFWSLLLWTGFITIAYQVWKKIVIKQATV